LIDGAYFMALFANLVRWGDNLVLQQRKVGCNNAQIQT
jgi:hypothetical protein